MGVMQPGDEVIVPANTYIATILAITENNLVPVLVEPKPNSLQINDNLIEGAITTKTKAIALVHHYGRLAYTDKIGEICQKYNLKFIEDCAQSHGCKHTDGRVTGNIGDAAGHSFYPGKSLGYFGFSCEELLDFVIRNRFQGLDRIVPIGETTAFSLTWDGYNLIEMFSRIQSVS